MSNPLPYTIYFLGPLALAILARRALGVDWKVAGIGLLTFLGAWTVVMLVTQTLTALAAAFVEGAFLYTLLVATAAGVFEESGRYAAFRFFRRLRRAPTWQNGLMFAVGHSGAESLIVGGSLVLTAAVLAYAPESLSPDLLAASREVFATGTAAATYAALERLLIGFLMHAAFTLVVVLAVARSELRFLAIAIAWHAVHDVIAQNLPAVPGRWTAHAAWIGFIAIAYSWILLRLIRALGPADPEDPADPTNPVPGAAGAPT